jgi:CheY-like chemotaxis protein
VLCHLRSSSVTLPKSTHLHLVASSRDRSDKKLANPSGEPLRVLIVEDDAAVAAILTDIVENCGGLVVGMITSGLASVGAAGGTRPHVIVMDVGLPGMDGIDAAAIIRARYPIPIVFISGRDIQAEVTQRLHDLEGIEMLVKPIDQTTLCEAIHRAQVQSASR